MTKLILRLLAIVMLAMTTGVSIAQEDDTITVSLSASLPDCYTEAVKETTAAFIQDLHEEHATLRLDITYNVIRLMADLTTPAELIDGYITTRAFLKDEMPDGLPCRQSFLLQQATERLLNDMFVFYLLLYTSNGDVSDAMQEVIIASLWTINEVAPFYDGDTTLIPAHVAEAGK